MARGVRGEKAVVFNYDARRSQRVPKALFAGYRGYLQSDGYAGYNILEGEGGIMRVGCWAHARRKFVDALKCAPRGGEGTVASAAVKMIKNLYEIERGIGEAPTEERFLVRQKISKPILDEMRRWLDKNIAEVLPKSLTGKALGYLNNEWENLARYIDSGDLSIDNNLAERAIKPFAYLKHVFTEIPKSTSAAEIAARLRWEFKKLSQL